jgi:aspartyl-tRNA(Asn)/glutamyl-tRNA(Gln) amidotransferase subunit C
VEETKEIMKINKQDVVRVAELAHLELSEAEVESLRAQLDSILSYIDKLKKLDVSGIEPMAQILQANTSPDAGLRDDTVRPSSVAAPILEQAPESKKPYFRVPRVIER